MAQISADHKEDAFATIEAALKIKPHHPDLLLLKARCLHIYSKDEYKIKSLLSEAYKNGQRKEVIFDLWFDIEIDNNPADAVDVVSKAINCGFDTRKWRERKGVAIFRRAMSRNSKMHTEVLDDLLGSMRELKRALSKNPSFIDRKRIQNYTQQILEQLIVKISGTGFEINDRASFIDTLYAIRKEKISQDKTINDEARRQMEEIRKVFASKRSASRGEILLLNRLSDKVDEMQ